MKWKVFTYIEKVVFTTNTEASYDKLKCSALVKDETSKCGKLEECEG